MAKAKKKTPKTAAKAPARKKAARKKATKKKATKKKATRKKATKRKATKRKATRKKAVKSASPRSARKSDPSRKASARKLASIARRATPPLRRSAGGIGEDAVIAATGYGWSHWFEILDRAGAKKMNHKSIARLLSDKHLDSGWWAQMITVAYEQDRGLRDKHEQPDGYHISGSKTVPVPIAKLYGAWKTAPARKRWLGTCANGLVVRKATANKSMRITWSDKSSHLDVYFWNQGPKKSQVSVQHTKLPDKKAADRQKTFWTEALARLARALD